MMGLSFQQEGFRLNSSKSFLIVKVLSYWSIETTELERTYLGALCFFAQILGHVQEAEKWHGDLNQ